MPFSFYTLKNRWVAIKTHAGDTTSENEDGESGASSKERVLKEAHARFELAKEAESEIRRLALEDLEFRAGKQWPDSVEQERNRDGRPCLVINRIPQFIQQITNDQRQNRPAIKVHPVDDNADVETGKVIQGLVRHIEYNSNADVAYDTAFDSAATGGFGYFRFLTEFVSPLSFDQEILIKRIRDPFSVFFDPYSQEPDGSDASWAFIIEDLSPEEFKARYPHAKLTGDPDWGSVGAQAPGWIRDGAARVAEYFYKETKDVEIVLLSNGVTLEKSKLAEYAEQIHQHQMMSGQPFEDITIVRERTAQVPVVKWCKLNADEILEETEWLGKWIPIVPVFGTDLYINGKRILEGIVRNAKDSQRMYNYWASAETEAIALAPRTPFIMAEGQDEGYQADWASANRRNHSVLKYKPTSLNGQPIGPPQRNVFEPAVGAITNARMVAAEDLKATTGIYDAALGARSNETSGVAIQRRNVQAQTSNFHFIDNLTRSLRHAGRILVDLIPRIYDTSRTARIIGDDGEQRVIKVNQHFEDESGKPIIYQLDAGKYDVTVDVGPSFASKRQEAVASMLEVTRAYPAIAQAAGDLIVKNMDWPGATEIAERLKKTLPPGLADDPKQKNTQIPPQLQQQMQQMSQMVEQLTAKLHEAQDAIETKRIELESRERIEAMKIEAAVHMKMAEIDHKDSLALLSAELEGIKHRQDLLRSGQPIVEEGFSQSYAPEADGAMSADIGQGADHPTGGESPGPSMEGYSNDDHSTF